jgi:hypothetical protein
MTVQLNLLYLLSIGLHLSYGFVPKANLFSTATRRGCTESSSSSSGGFVFETETRDSLFAKLEEQLQLLLNNYDYDDEDEDDTAARLSLFNSRLANIQLNRTVLGPSTVVPGQRGLFASRDCSKGDLLTCYPGDLVVVIPDEGDYTILTGDHVSEKDKKTFQDPDYDISDELMGYLLHATDDHGVLGLPSLDEDPAYFGHFANDGAVMPTQASNVDAYVKESLAKANVKHDMISCHMVTVATQEIQKGEEILVSYGPEYWMAHSDFE